MCNKIYFSKFLSNIEPSSSTIDTVSSIQSNLRIFLSNNYNNYISSFLSGSYAKNTCIRPTAKDDTKRDVDIVVITNLNKAVSSDSVLLQLYKMFSSTKKYSDVILQHHSVGITMSQLKIDVIPVLVDQKDKELYYIADSQTGKWYKTDPKGHIKWSTEVNRVNDGLYKPLVKIFKWWRQINCPSNIKFPKGITLEKIIADNIDCSLRTIELTLVNTMVNIVESYENYTNALKLPIIRDPSPKIESNNLLSGYKFVDFYSFVETIRNNLSDLSDEVNGFNTCGFSNDLWRKILGSEFPKANI